ncbi:hypothetical protein PENTCL1PPCAC_10274, partial [Pristionchus entomophagus]
QSLLTSVGRGGSGSSCCNSGSGCWWRSGCSSSGGSGGSSGRCSGSGSWSNGGCGGRWNCSSGSGGNCTRASQSSPRTLLSHKGIVCCVVAEICARGTVRDASLGIQKVDARDGCGRSDGNRCNAPSTGSR